MTTREMLRITSVPSLLQCLAKKLRDYAERCDETLALELRMDAETIELKATMIRIEEECECLT